MVKSTVLIDSASFHIKYVNASAIDFNGYIRNAAELNKNINIYYIVSEQFFR